MTRCRHWRGESGDGRDTVGIHRVEVAGRTAVRRQGRTDLYPEHRQGRSTRSPPRWEARGSCGAGDALEDGQDRLRTHPAGAWALDKGLHLTRSTSMGGVGVAHAPVAPRARCPWLPGYVPWLGLHLLELASLARWRPHASHRSPQRSLHAPLLACVSWSRPTHPILTTQEDLCPIHDGACP